MTKRYWLLKSEPTTFSFDDLKTSSGKKTSWDGIRNYQARNIMRDDMKIGDLGFFYHSSCPQPGVVGVVEVVSKPYPDHTAWDKKSNYYDPKASPENPRWVMVDVKWKEDFKNFVPLEIIKATAKLGKMKVVQKGMRLSIQPVTKDEFDVICKLGRQKK